jgi:transposase
MPRSQVSTEKKMQAVGMLQAGKKAEEVATIFDVSRSTIFEWKKRFAETDSVARKQRTGGYRVSTAAQDQALQEYLKDPQHCFETANDAIRATNFPGCRSTAYKRLWDVNLHSRIAAQREKLLPRHKEVRTLMAEEWLALDDNVWDYAVWSDEKVYQSSREGQVRVWRTENTRYEPENIFEMKRSGRFSVHVWGYIHASGHKHIHKIEGAYDRFNYLSVLQDVMLPSMRLIIPEGAFLFIQDNAPIHTAHVVRDFLEEQNRNDQFWTLQWPAKSPDLNLIENAWGLSVKYLKKHHPAAFESREELWANIQESWEVVVTPQLCRSLVNSFRGRLEQVIANGGAWCNY